MAEFQEVMRQWGRYCKGYTENHNDDCDGCPFEINGSCNSYAKDNAQYAEQIEKHVMSWAAEHPEPVYPTWGEYIRSITGLDPVEVNGMRLALTRTIPAEIAQKLGLGPKEDIC
jgi:hypothetical protein